MKIPYFCCIGAELKRYAKDFDFMNQVYLYKVPTDDTIEEVFAQDYFQPVADTVLDDDIVYIYEPTTQVLYTCHFKKQNGHITVEQMANNIPALTPNKILISDEDGKIAAGDLSLEDIVVKISTEKQIMQGGLQTPELETDDLTVNGTAEFDNAPTTNDTTTYQNATSDSLVRKEQVDEVIQDIKTSSLTFIGYVSTTAPSSATYALNKHDLWLNSATMPTSFPFPQANIKEWDGTAWVAYNHDYTPANFDFFRNVNNNEGYYWFGGEWVVMSTDMSTTYFQLNSASGKWEIKSNVNLPGAPTTTTPTSSSPNNQIATKEYVDNSFSGGGANTSLSNLTSTGANIGNWSSNVTNCITEIPQDIKLELNNGALTLKAGSKVYVPNGVGNFDELVIQNDLTTISSWGEQVRLSLFVKSDGSTMFIINMEERCSSGSSAPTATNIQIWYDTTNNLVKRYAGGADTGDRYSLPIALVQKGDAVESSNISRIDQIFNGFGYIGSTVFALPGVKGLAPNGRNADGTLSNIVKNLTNVTTRDFSDRGGLDILYLNSSNQVRPFDVPSFNIDKYPTPAANQWYLTYSTIDNRFYRSDNGAQYVEENNICFFGKVSCVYQGNITLFNTYKTSRAVDYSDTEYIGHQAMPHWEKRINIILPASGSQLVAPTDGYFCIVLDVAANSFLSIDNNYYQIGNTSGYVGGYYAVRKGFAPYISYSNRLNTIVCCFVPAVGAQ